MLSFYNFPMFNKWIRHAWLRLRRWQWWWVLGTCAAVTGVAWPTQVLEKSQDTFPGIAPHRLAHLLADFNNHPHLYPNLGSWSIKEEASSLSSWSYKVQYECGRSCEGSARVGLWERPAAAAGYDGLPHHGQHGKSYLLVVSHTQCSSIPYLIWFQICRKWESEVLLSEVKDEMLSGSLYAEKAWQECTVLRVLSGRCAAELRAGRLRHMQQLHRLLSV